MKTASGRQRSHLGRAGRQRAEPFSERVNSPLPALGEGLGVRVIGRNEPVRRLLRQEVPSG